MHNHPEWAAKKFSKLNGLSVKKNLKIRQDDPEYMGGKITPSEFAGKYIKSMNLKVTEKEFHAIYTSIFSLNTPLFNFLKKLRKQAKPAMLSNTEKVTIEFLMKKYPALFALFNKNLFFSCKLKSTKPGKQIFLHALKSAKARPEETVFIDDKKENISAAKRLGMHAFRYTTLASLKNNLKKSGLKIQAVNLK
ncbi:HAD family phosphatase [archaeon]|nr:HAD family phosphatase [archaeon]